MSGADIVRACCKAEEKLVSSSRRNEALAGEGGTVKCALIARVAAISGMSEVKGGNGATIAAKPTRWAVTWRSRARKRGISSPEVADCGDGIVEVGGGRGECWAGWRDCEVSGDCTISCGVRCNEGESIVSGTTEAEARILESSWVGETGVAGGGGGGDRQTRQRDGGWWFERWINANRGLRRTRWQMSHVNEKRSWSECAAGMKPLKFSARPQMLQV